MILPPPFFAAWMVLGRWWAVPGFLQTWHLEGQTIQSWFHATRASCLSQSESFRCFYFLQSPSRLSVWPLFHKAQIIVLQWLFSYRKFLPSSLRISTSYSISYQGPSPLIAQFGRAAIVLLFYFILFYFIFFVPFPRSVPLCNPSRPFLWPNCLVFCSHMHCKLWDLDGCVSFPNHAQSIEFATGRLQSRCRDISKVIKRNARHLSSISSIIANSLNTCANVMFHFFLFNKLAKNYLLGHYGVLSANWWWRKKIFVMILA